MSYIPLYMIIHRKLYDASVAGEDIEKILIEADADVNIQDKDGQTALSRAAWNGHVDIAKILIEADADVNMRQT